ncbi:MAG: RNA-binding S4 domain-containing protein [Prevotella sp.]|nr:RNA-binding S4 domain-containing protein [Prevotella sp.]MBR4268491.1 RNA-binding S4 domain-containing protein [Prevotella sp.]
MNTLKQQESARLDKWLWAARIFKTRTLAADACKNGRVAVTDSSHTTSTPPVNASAKPSRTVKVGETIHVRKPPVTYSFKIINAIENRVGAKLLNQVYENVTDAKQYELLEMARISGFVDRAKGTGRPTKKDRRAMEAFTEPAMFGWNDEDDDSFFFDEE